MTRATRSPSPMKKVKQDPPNGLIDKKVESYKGFKIYKSTDFYMQPSRYAFIAAPEDRWYVKLPDGKTWLYSEGDDPNDILIFSRPQYARQVIDRYVAGERTFGEE